MHLPTIFVIHPRERRKKCSIEPLRGRDGFLFHKFPQPLSIPLDGYVRVGLDAPLLSQRDADSGLLLLDGTWRLVEQMESECRDLPVRSLPAWKTAYPRVSKTFDNPAAGLATIEAVYAAYTLLGRDTTGLLDDYYWADEFLALNADSLVNPQS